MKIYIHDYSKPSEAESLLYSAARFMEKGIYLPAKKHITQASLLLRQFLAGDNLIIDPDAVGLIKGEDFFDEHQLAFIRDEFACIMEQTNNANDELDIVNKCCRLLEDPEYESYEEFAKDTSGSWAEKYIPEEDEP